MFVAAENDEVIVEPWRGHALLATRPENAEAMRRALPNFE